MATEDDAALCDDCGLRFITPGWSSGFFMGDGVSMVVTNMRVGPCPRCGGMGRPIGLLSATSAGGQGVVSSSPATLAMMLELLSREELDAEQTARALEESSPALRPLAEWIRRNHMHVAAWAAVVIAVLTPYLASSGVTPEQVQRIITEVVEQIGERSDEPAEPPPSLPRGPQPPANSGPTTAEPETPSTGL